ncbi:dihydrodipicolinate reductase [Candidatus Magnetobacterium bavaricum]|uniref:4-hydroxy-tetrahydrodipicolinate reductase n=1 Tax=Candidatus Magnetobacterium bavaricum TaxID=29290 RepID=A0A0F3GQG0_9BACT|nr:dihydrodipicolinate reductase [Candidatus Magnetobacterium bavaricum]
MTKVTVVGAAGKMGQRIGVLAVQHQQIELSGALEMPGHAAVGRDFGEVAGVSRTNVVISYDVADAISRADVVIDFTSPEPTLEHVRACVSAKKPIVIGTTGLTETQVQEIRGLSVSIPIVLSPNMSVGVNLLLKVLSDVAPVLADDYDIEIIEAHHRLKKDAPSGTALKMAGVIAQSIGRDLGEVAVYARHGMTGERTRDKIGIQTIRAGDIVGEHTVLFGAIGERIEFTHKASSRDTFAAGALRAALWLQGKPSGLYDMQDVLGLR